jgi:signal transduction histidine kinase
MSGLDISKQIKEDPTTSNTMVLQISAHYISSVDRTAALKGGADSYLMEPVPAEEFLASVEALLRLHAREEEYRRLLRDLSTRGAEEQSLFASTDRSQAQDQIRRLAAQLAAVKEQEREKLAQSLHDDLAQLLIVARLKLHQQRRRPAEQTMQEIDNVLDQCLTYTRSLMSDLMPRELSHGELNAALRWLAAPMHEHGLTVVVNVPDDAVILAENTAITIVKCVRELLFNVLKHADTQEAFLTMVVTDDIVRVIVQDRGRGWNVTPMGGSAPHTFGLFSVQQRVELLGGRLEITSKPGSGTRATLTVPRDAPSPC